jgi:hypothetical protein
MKANDQYSLIKWSRDEGVLGVLATGTKEKVEEYKEALLEKINSRNYSVRYRLSVWKVQELI